MTFPIYALAYTLCFKKFKRKIALTSLSNGPLFAQFTADLIFAAIADSRKLLLNEP